MHCFSDSGFRISGCGVLRGSGDFVRRFGNSFGP